MKKRPAAPLPPLPGWQPPQNRARPGKPVLDLEKLNLGTTEIIRSPGGTEPKPGDLVKLLDVTGDDRLARTFTVVMGSTFLQPDFPPGEFVTGPVSGIIEFGNGAAFARLEFDIPFLSRIPSIPGPADGGIDNKFKSPYFSGTSVAVTGSAIRVFARNDNNLPPVRDPTVIIGVNPAIFGTVDPTVFAHVSYDPTFGGNRALYKSICVYGFNGASMAPNETAFIGIPPFAKEVSFLRRSVESTQLDITFLTFAGALQSGVHEVSPGSVGPLLIPPWANEIAIVNGSIGTDVLSLTAVFTLVV